MWNGTAHSTPDNSINFTVVSPEKNATNYGMCAKIIQPSVGEEGTACIRYFNTTQHLMP
jgi:hypothetical protein